MKKFITLLLAMALVFSLVACGGNNAANEANTTEATNATNTTEATDSTDTTEATEEVNMRPFVAGTGDFNGDFYAGWTNSTYDKNIRQLVWGFGLMTDTIAGEIVDSPMVVEKTVSDDLTEWTFKIQDGITFHNGEEMTVSDIKFTYEFYMDKDALTATGGSSSLQDYIDTITIDEATNTITFKLLKVIFTTDASVFYETWILPEDTITAGADAAGQTVQEYVKTNISNPIGYGPYKFVEFKESEYVRLAINEDYIGEMPAIQEIIVRHTPSETN
jgi:ABC-type transport system substrate-binding protein